VCDGDPPLNPITAKERRQIDESIKNGDSDEVDQHSAVMPINVPG
jgi:hypothetical protein